MLYEARFRMSYNKGRDKGPRVNLFIRAETVRLIDDQGEMLGVVKLADAQAKAKDAKLDLVEIVPNAEPPVCKIMDYGKYKYEAQKKSHDSRKKQKTVSLKEVKLRPNIDTHDLDIKINRARKFIESGDKVKFSLRYRGREITHKEYGLKVINTIKEKMDDIAKVEVEPKFEGMLVLMVIGPR